MQYYFNILYTCIMDSVEVMKQKYHSSIHVFSDIICHVMIGGETEITSIKNIDAYEQKII